MASSEETIASYRIVAPRWAATAFSGEGVRKYGGRWNSPGRSVVYLAGSRALAALEMLVHLTTPDSRKKEYRIIEARFPASMVRDAPSLSVGIPSMRYGDDWIAAGKTLSLRVPSALIPEEPNYLLNPMHPDFTKVVIGEATDFHFDPRL